MSIVIINITESELEPFKKLGLNVLCANVKDFCNSTDTVYFVSPANSLLFMDGGIDMAFLEMFKNDIPGYNNNIRSLQYFIQDSLKKDDIPMSLLGRKYLPIGSAICTKIPNKNKYIISSPTMLLPQNVSKTQNAYYAMSAALKVWNGNGLLVVPLLACGIGKMDLNEAARQIKKAIDERSYYIGDKYISEKSAEILNNQPKIYQNTEFFKCDIYNLEKN